jgi:hypothetical protein
MLQPSYPQHVASLHPDPEPLVLGTPWQVRNAALAPLTKHKLYPNGFPAERIVFIVSHLHVGIQEAAAIADDMVARDGSSAHPPMLSVLHTLFLVMECP